MAISLVGSKGVVATSSGPGASLSSADGLAWGTSENRTAGNLLILVVNGYGSATTPGAIAGWTKALSSAGTLVTSTIYYKIAAGTDAIPTVAAIASSTLIGQLMEFTGNVASSPADKNGSASSTTSPSVATTSGADTNGSSLVIAVAAWRKLSSAVNTGAHTLNNGAAANSTNNNATSTTQHYDFAHGITTGNGSADSDSYAFTNTPAGISNSIVSFKAAAIVGAAARSITDTITAAGTRTAIGAAAISIADTITVAGTRNAVSAAAVPITDTIHAAAFVSRFGAATLSITDTYTVSGVRTSHGSAGVVETLTFVVAGDVKTTIRGAAALPIVITIRCAGGGSFPPGDIGSLTESSTGLITETRRGEITFAREGGIA